MDFKHIEEKMEKTISVLVENFAEVRAGRANPAILNKIRVDYYGTPTPINQVAGISVPEARLIVIQPWDASLLKEIEKEILKAEIGINPNNDGKVIRLAFPELNEERRKELVKDIKKMAEESKVAIRAIRRDGIDEAKAKQKNSEITEDELKLAENEIQKLTDKKHPLEILAAIQTMLRKWILIKTKSSSTSTIELAKLTGLHEFVVKQTISKLKTTTAADLVNLKQNLFNVECRIKSAEALDIISEVEIALIR